MMNIMTAVRANVVANTSSHTCDLPSRLHSLRTLYTSPPGRHVQANTVSLYQGCILLIEYSLIYSHHCQI